MTRAEVQALTEALVKDYRKGLQQTDLPREERYRLACGFHDGVRAAFLSLAERGAIEVTEPEKGLRPGILLR